MESFLARGGVWVLGQGVLFVAALAALWAGGSIDVGAGQLGLGSGVAVGGLLLATDGVVRIRRHITAMPAPVAGARLMDNGAFGLVRHPIYGGLAVAVAGLGVMRGSVAGLGVSAALLAYFYGKSRSEERRLAVAYPGYAEYRRRVRRRLIPWVF